MYASTINTINHNHVFSHLLSKCCSFLSDLEHRPSCSLHWSSLRGVNPWTALFGSLEDALQIHLCSVKVIGHFSDKAAGQFQGEDPCHVIWGVGGGDGGPGGGEIPATCENSLTQTITEGQPGYQEAEVGQEQDRGGACLYRDVWDLFMWDTNFCNQVSHFCHCCVTWSQLLKGGYGLKGFVLRGFKVFLNRTSYDNRERQRPQAILNQCGSPVPFGWEHIIHTNVAPHWNMNCSKLSGGEHHVPLCFAF